MSEQPGEMRPRVSVGLPVYNGARHLQEALTSVLEQDHADLEILICDNASTDGTPRICMSEGSDPRVQYKRFDTMSDASDNFNRAFHLTSNEFFCWVAHDDRMRPGYVRAAVTALLSEPDTALCAPSIVFIDEAGDPIGVYRENPELASHDLATRLRCYLYRPAWFMVYGLARRSALEATALFPASYGPDVILVWEILLRHRVCVLKEPLFEYRVRPSGPGIEALATAPDAGADRFGSCSMWLTMWRATRSAPLSPHDRAVARRALVIWLGTRYFRRLFFNDWYSELRLAVGRGERVRAAAVLVGMFVLRPLYCLDTIRRRENVTDSFSNALQNLRHASRSRRHREPGERRG